MKRSFLLCCLALCIIAAAPLTAQAGSQPAEQTITVNVNVAEYASITASESVGFIIDPSVGLEEGLEGAPVTVLANFDYQVVMSSSNVAFLDAGVPAAGDYPYAVDDNGNSYFFLPFVQAGFPENVFEDIVALWIDWGLAVDDTTFGGAPGVTAEFTLRVLPMTAFDASGVPFEFPLAGSYSGDLILTVVEQ